MSPRRTHTHIHTQENAHPLGEHTHSHTHPGECTSSRRTHIHIYTREIAHWPPRAYMAAKCSMGVPSISSLELVESVTS